MLLRHRLWEPRASQPLGALPPKAVLPKVLRFTRRVLHRPAPQVGKICRSYFIRCLAGLATPPPRVIARTFSPPSGAPPRLAGRASALWSRGSWLAWFPLRQVASGQGRAPAPVVRHPRLPARGVVQRLCNSGMITVS